MTLLIASATQDEQIIVADRLLVEVPTFKIRNESAYKIIRYVNPNRGYSFAIAYTGLASFGRETITDWILETLPVTMPPSMYVGDGIAQFRDACTKRFSNIRNIRLQFRSATFVLCGSYLGTLKNSKEKQIPFISTVSNSQDSRGNQINTVSRSFTAISRRLMKPGAYAYLCRGDLHTAQKSLRELHSVFRFLRKSISYKAKVKYAAKYIEKQSAVSKSIGSDTLGLAISGQFAEAFDFHIFSANPSVTMPHTVWASGAKATNFTATPV